MWSAGAYIHDKSDGAMGKHLVGCQLSRSFFPASGLESKPEHHQKRSREAEMGAQYIHVSPRVSLFFL